MIADLLKSIEQYQAQNPFEIATRTQFIQFLNAFGEAALLRSCLTGHLTASGWILDQETQTHALLLKHVKLNKWLQPGGHADGDADLLRVARKEVEEETGLTVLNFENKIFDLDVHAIPVYGDVPAHLHLDVRYLFTTAIDSTLTISHESREMRWVPLSEIGAFGVDSSVMRLLEKSKHLIS